MSNPFKGRPHTRLHYDEAGQPWFAVTISELTPFRARSADALADLCTWLFLIFLVMFMSGIAYLSAWYWAIGLILPIVIHPVTKRFIRVLFRKQKTVVFGPETFSIKNVFGNNDFNRSLEHRFLLLPHDNTKREKEDIALKVVRARRTGRIISPEKYYGESFHLVYQHLGERFDITSIYGEIPAHRALDRLTAINKVIDSKTYSAPGMPLSPTDEWHPQPGELPRK